MGDVCEFRHFFYNLLKQRDGFVESSESVEVGRLTDLSLDVARYFAPSRGAGRMPPHHLLHVMREHFDDLIELLFFFRIFFFLLRIFFCFFRGALIHDFI